MQKIKTVLRLAGLGLSQRQIALSCQVGQATVSDYLRMAAAAGITWPDIADWDEDRLRASLSPALRQFGAGIDAGASEALSRSSSQSPTSGHLIPAAAAIRR